MENTRMRAVINYLQQPSLVADVQKYFGVRPKRLSSSIKSENYSVTEKTSGDYQIENSFWFWLFTIATALGDEIFYASFIPFWFWNIDGAVGRRVICMWTITMYIGQGIKDLLKWPRPSYPAKRLQKKWSEEYGMPSTHAMVAITMPLSIILYTMNRYIYSLVSGSVCAFCWCTLICVSRVYLGMHSILDIVAGLLLALILMIPLVPFIDTMDEIWLTASWSPMLILAISLLVIIYFPRTENWTPTWGDTTMIISVCAGILIGSWFNFKLGNMTPFPHPPPYLIIWPDSFMLGLIALRSILGFFLVVLTRSLLKKTTRSFLCSILHVESKDLNAKVRSVGGKITFVELGVKFITYFFIGFNIVFSIPILFRFMGIERPTFYTEI